jgi:hypothetical protein
MRRLRAWSQAQGSNNQDQAEDNRHVRHIENSSMQRSEPKHHKIGNQTVPIKPIQEITRPPGPDQAQAEEGQSVKH